MESQFKRGVLDALVLAVLEKGESYGYKLVRDVGEFIEITESTLYPILKRLLAAGLLVSESREYNGRLRKYYSITDKGREHITDLMREWESIVRIYNYIKEERQ
ncbi:MAG: PadR family transcriptional regulator [Clostridia bacterium]|nr:PadR family transcriptional regulator [Clostridia bacterium]